MDRFAADGSGGRPDLDVRVRVPRGELRDARHPGQSAREGQGEVIDVSPTHEESHMARHQHRRVALGILIVLGVLGLMRGNVVQTCAVDQIPAFELDPSWPKPLPNDWGFGEAW